VEKPRLDNSQVNFSKNSQNPRSTLGTHSYKTQGTLLVRSLVTTTTTTIKGPSST